MSFKDLESGCQWGRSGCKLQEKQWHHEESSCERNIKANIQKLRESARLAGEQFERSHRVRISKRMCDSLETALERSQALVFETEQLFRDWTVHLAGELRVRHKKKLAYDKLEKAFREEVANLDAARRLAVMADKKVADVDGHEESEGHHESLPSDALIGEDDVAILALARSEVMKSSQCQKYVAVEPPAGRLSIGKTAEGRGSTETTERRRSQFERLYCRFALAMLIMLFALVYHLHPSSASLTKLASFRFDFTNGARPRQQSLILEIHNLVRMH